MPRTYRLVISCPDRLGIVSRVSAFVSGHRGWIIEANQHLDAENGWFFMRYEILADSLPFDIHGLREGFAPIAEEFGMKWRVTDSDMKKRVILMCSKEEHCVSDLLYRWRSGEMQFEIPCVISNHESMRDLVEFHRIPYHYVPVSAETKAAHFADIIGLIARYWADTIVLARYMQILPAEVCRSYPGQVINIHHSFLPAFVGAKPYHQAAKRGVKLIGATCHYATEELDAGPIIEQDVNRINHGDSIEEMVRRGKDVEKTVLARGLRYHLEDRVIVHENKTVVFD